MAYAVVRSQPLKKEGNLVDDVVSMIRHSYHSGGVAKGVARIVDRGG